MRFVIHDHIIENRHFDLMIEMQDQELLITWRIMSSDMDLLLKGSEIKAFRIQDHEKYFLNYEGSLSSGNGFVKFFDFGESELIKKSNDNIIFTLSGQVLTGTLHIKLLKEKIYKIKYFPEYAIE